MSLSLTWMIKLVFTEVAFEDWISRFRLRFVDLMFSLCMIGSRMLRDKPQVTIMAREGEVLVLYIILQKLRVILVDRFKMRKKTSFFSKLPVTQFALFSLLFMTLHMIFVGGVLYRPLTNLTCFVLLCLLHSYPVLQFTVNVENVSCQELHWTSLALHLQVLQREVGESELGPVIVVDNLLVTT